VVAGVVMVAALLGASACAGGDDDESASVEPAATIVEDRPEAPSEEAGGDGAVSEGGEGVPNAGGGIDLDLGSIGRDVIVEIGVTLESTDLRATVEGITSAVAAAGGGIASSQIDYLDEDPTAPVPEGDEPPPAQGYAYLVVKVPPTELERIVAGLDRLGTVVSVSQSAQDVTDQLTDLEVRIANARASVERVRSLLEEATDLSDVVLIESELTQRQILLEELLASQQNISERVALATLTIEVVPAPTDPIVEEDDDGIAAAFRDGWEAFVAVLAGTVLVLALLSPFLVLGLVVLGVVLLVVRSRRRRTGVRDNHAAAPLAAPTPDAGTSTLNDPVSVSTDAPRDDASPTA
jgi:hypothetical protein